MRRARRGERRPRRLACLTLVLAPVAALAGCGYSTGLALAGGHGSLGIELFGNDSPERDVERELHAALTRAARDLVDAEVVAPEQAGLVLRGKVLDYRFRGGLRSSDNRWVETGLTIRVQAGLWDPARGAMVAGPIAREAEVGFVRDDPLNELEARERALTNVAERLVLELLTAPPEEAEAPPGP